MTIVILTDSTLVYHWRAHQETSFQSSIHLQIGLPDSFSTDMPVFRTIWYHQERHRLRGLHAHQEAQCCQPLYQARLHHTWRHNAVSRCAKAGQAYLPAFKASRLSVVQHAQVRKLAWQVQHAYGQAAPHAVYDLPDLGLDSAATAQPTTAQAYAADTPSRLADHILDSVCQLCNTGRQRRHAPPLPGTEMLEDYCIAERSYGLQINI